MILHERPIAFSQAFSGLCHKIFASLLASSSTPIMPVIVGISEMYLQGRSDAACQCLMDVKDSSMWEGQKKKMKGDY
jgi:hypothetical protein